MMNLKLTLIILILTAFSMILTSISLVQISNAVNSINPNTIDCNSKKGTADTFAGPLKYGGVKCEGQNDGTASAGGIKSNSGSIGIHGIIGPNDNSHLTTNLRR
jgi:hypothetical protein